MLQQRGKVTKILTVLCLNKVSTPPALSILYLYQYGEPTVSAQLKNTMFHLINLYLNFLRDYLPGFESYPTLFSLLFLFLILLLIIILEDLISDWINKSKKQSPCPFTGPYF
jgi:hypothetical protein